jgi:hypothetical protein
METLFEILISWTPMIILIVVWIVFMRIYRRPQDQTIAHLQRQNELMEKYIGVTERIAMSLEKISNNK